MDGRLRRHGVRTEIRDYVREVRARSTDEHALVNVIIPETVSEYSWRHILHNLRVQRIKATLVREKDVVVTNVAHHAGYEELEPVGQPIPRQLVAEWRHVAVVLVAGVHNATGQALRYALSLQADELRCVHVQVEDVEAERAVLDWDELHTRLPLDIIASPYRQIVRPVHAYVRAILEEKPRTFVTIVIPEFIEQRWWHRFLHSQTALTLKGTFLFEPSVVVSAVPYRL